ncbi:MAG: putative lipoprotein [Labilithrix sp.]|nr:putative lipoprotein [Labilithrix sp.]
MGISGRFGTLAMTLALVLSASTGTLGCKKLLKKSAGADGGTATAASGSAGSTNTPQDDIDEQMQEKLDGYIICTNTLSSPVHQQRARYFSWVNPKTGVTGKETSVGGIGELPPNAAKKCTDGLAKSKALPPHDPKLEAAGDDFARSVTELDGIIGELFTYYENKNYKDDKFAKGKAMHPRLMAAFQSFSKADNNLHATLDGITKPLAQRALGRIEREEGKGFRYHRKHVLLAARELVEAGDPVGEDDNIDFALYNASFTEFDKALNDLNTFGQAHKTELDAKTNPAWPRAKSNFDSFGRSAEEYRKKSREYLRCLRDAPAKAKVNGKIIPDKLGPCPDGKPHDVVEKYNDFIKSSNESQFP